MICILYCFTDVNQDDSPKSLWLNLRTPKYFNCNLPRTTSHWEVANFQENGDLIAMDDLDLHPTQDASHHQDYYKFKDRWIQT